MINNSDIERLFERQMSAWPEAAQRIRALDEKVERRKVGSYIVQWNPARAVSTLAKVDSKSLEKRPCFLCRENRPSVQEGISILEGRWEVLVNPFPILERHLTIVSTQHTPQRLSREDFEDMVEISRSLPGYVVFYNGARCGASAPDHKHLQAGKADALPRHEYEDSEKVWEDIVSLPVPEGREEPDFNLLMQEGRALLIPRSQHRPKCYHDGTCLVSPGALDMAGLIITPREEDFRHLTEEQIRGILCECGTPEISVGIMEADGIDADETPDGFTLHGVTIGKDFHWQRRQDQSFRGRLRITENKESGKRLAVNDIGIEDYLLSVISSEMSGTSDLQLLKAHAVISRSWALRMIENRQTEYRHLSPTGRKETPFAYGTKGDTFRLRDERRQQIDTAGESHGEACHIRIYDSSAHTLFDVCADDHCQRYQGIGGVNAMVERAIRETRGEVLVSSEGELCDTRFSKCCGGRTERFSTCWQDKEYSYLQPVECPYCDTHDKHLLRQVLNDYDQETTTFHDWQVRYTQEELSRLAEEKLHLGVGRILDLQPLSRGASGRISLLRVVGTERSVDVGKELEIRKMLSPTHLLSSNFEIQREGTDFILSGHGWGHGVGLCQIGAAVMAAEGHDYRSILAHYYPTSRIIQNYAR